MVTRLVVPVVKAEFDSTVKRLPSLVACLILPLILSVSLSSCGNRQKDAKKEGPAVPVEVGEVIQRDSPLFLEGIGNVEAYNTVDVKCRVTGQLIKTFFKDGDSVVVGQRLFTVDPAPFEAKVKETEAKLKQSKVQHDRAFAPNTFREHRIIRIYQGVRLVAGHEKNE